ncbi:MAG: N-acetyltransferase family protein [Bacteroidetes bacterium]|nr:MAG: N-acetyltransferase family protein [Bacteroidota bacterium]
MEMFNIRLATEKDASAIADIYRPFVENTTVSFETTAPTPAEMAQRIKACEPKYPWLVCVRGEEVAGYAYAGLHRKRAAYQWTTEVSVYVHPDFRKRRIGSALYTALFDILRCQGYKNILAGITLPNPRSVAFHEAMGFRFFAKYESVGFKMGAWRSTAWYRMSFQDGPPAPLRPVGEVAHSEAWGHLIGRALSLIRPPEPRHPKKKPPF